MTEAPAGDRWNILPLHLDTVLYPDWHPRAGEYGPVYAYLLESDELLVLVDTGLGPPHEFIDRHYQPARRDLLVALSQNNGIDASDIDAIVITHLHFDHLGGAQSFPGTPIYVQRTEWEAAQATNYTIPEWLHFPGANFRMLDADTELAPGLRLLTTPGHTPGHQVIGVTTPLGVMVLAGQIVETRAEMERFVATGELKDWNKDGSQLERVAGARRVLELNPVRVWFSHDHRQWEG